MALPLQGAVSYVAVDLREPLQSTLESSHEITSMIAFAVGLFYLTVCVQCISILLYTDKECKNQVGHLDGNFNALCQQTLGSAAISFKVVDPESGCLGI